jgi:cytochrome c oxidase subunit 5b
LSSEIPGFRESGQIATDYEVASGLERYELLKKLKGEDPWEDLHPITFKEKGTVKNPIEIKGIDEERYIGCTG